MAEAQGALHVLLWVQIFLSLAGTAALITGRLAAYAAVCLPIVALSAAILAYSVAERDWTTAAAAVITGVLWWSYWRRNRGGRDRVAKFAGYKARAAREKLAATQREAEVPR